MAVPSKVSGGGNNSTNRNVLRIKFSEATSNVPELHAWDDFNLSSITHEIFTGTTGNSNLPMLCAVATTDAAPGASNWKPAGVTAGGATINRLKGNDSFVNLASAAVAALDSVLFNVCWEIPSDASVPADLDNVLAVSFTYSGAAPVLTWYFNDVDDGGTEGTPVWTVLTPGSTGDKLAAADAGVSAPNIVVHRPAAGVIDAPEVWVIN